MSIPSILRERQISGQASHRLYSSSSFVKQLDLSHELRGHTGCVNALNWSADGRYLASGSDDTNVIVWDSHSAAFETRKVIHTGHTRNIFSVKFVPGSGNRTIISAAGDRQIRVFDVEYGGSAATIMEQPCQRTVYRAHHDRVKRIAVEDDGHCFLSCSEDGDIRQFDLREDNSVGNGYRAPLISYAKYQIDLNTLSLNKINPYLLATGGSHPCAFLHDRRMVGRDLKSEWGAVPVARTPTQCVKKFKSSKVQSSFRGEHITALHFGNVNPRELICSWSCDKVYLFDIHGDGEQSDSTTMKSTTSPRGTQSSSTQKRKRSSTPAAVELYIEDGADAYDILHATRRYLLTPPFTGRNYAAALESFETASDVVRERFRPPHGVELVEHLLVCEHLLSVLARDHIQDIDELNSDIVLWSTQALSCILLSFLDQETDPSTRRPIPEPYDTTDGPMMDPTHPTEQLFSSPQALMTSFNKIIVSSESIQRTHTDVGRRFWVDRVCRALLAATQPIIDQLERPTIPSAPNSDEFSAYGDDSDLEDDGEMIDGLGHLPEDDDDHDDDEGDSTEEEEEEGEDSGEDESDSEYGGEGFSSDDVAEERREEEYRDELHSAMHKVNSGVPIGTPIRSFSGHVNVETVKDVNFFGLGDEYVMSGSDDGLLFIWDKKTGAIVTMLRADDSVTNVMEGNPVCNTLAASGIDSTVKIFQPFEQHDERSPISRHVKETEYQVRARNERRAAGEEIEQHEGVRISRRMMLSLAGQFNQEPECRTQ
ncbi:protein of unknown function [Taphrina deformans PYCC 5710]|uniref:WD40 repeat-like protein n=1 Tax=Taphrina deformans (strain PYCC 5710 / ATCC 11124 / CBS 356.35 / IMI 108563 / JCM 9778 / NBRC 8474) TaxID=1097556 RepID=R4XD61_TAPDE|nr:protein of unknown function [Taphrina deformans PYCC 5710]|eukprot:CCG83760.1 protein of unknown function [Taphrina deformans PYCC 5710]